MFQKIIAVSLVVTLLGSQSAWCLDAGNRVSLADPSQMILAQVKSLLKEIEPLSDEEGNRIFVERIQKDLESKSVQLKTIIQDMKADFEKVTDEELGAHYYKKSAGNVEYAKVGAELRSYVQALDFDGLKNEVTRNANALIAEAGSAKKYLEGVKGRPITDLENWSMILLISLGVTVGIGILFLPEFASFTIAGMVLTSIIMGVMSITTINAGLCFFEAITDDGYFGWCKSQKPFSQEKDEYFTIQ